MAKFVFYAAAAAVAGLCALATGSAQAQNATRPPCVPLNFTAKAADIKSLNAVVDIAISSGMLKKFIPEPITVKDSPVSVVPFSVLGSNFELTPIIKNLAVSGVQTVLPKHLVVSSDNSIVLAADFNGTINVDGTIRVQIQQLDRKWYELCWTNVLNPVTCPPAILDVDVSLGVVKPSLVANTQLDLVACAAGVPRPVCKDVTVSDILIAALNNKFDTLLPRLLKRFTHASVLDLTLAFDSISELGVHFSTSGPLITELGKQLLQFSAEEVNKKGLSYKTLISVLQTLFKSVLNNLIKDKLAPGFGNTCYDA